MMRSSNRVALVSSSRMMAVRRQRRRWKSTQSTEPLSTPAEPPLSSSFLAQALTWYSNKLDTHPLITKGITSGIIAGTGDFICQILVDKPEKERAAKEAVVSKAASSPPLPVLPEGNWLWWWDNQRTIRFATLGALYVAPGCHYWYGALAARFPLVATTTSTTLAASTNLSGMVAARAVAQRVLWDQFAFTPAFLVGWMTCLWTLEEYMNTYQNNSVDTRSVSSSTTTPSMAESWSMIPTRLMQSLPNIMVANWLLWIPVQTLNFRFIPTKFQVLSSNCVALVWNAYLSFSTRTTTTTTTTNTQSVASSTAPRTG